MMGINDIKWWHSFNFPELTTNGADITSMKLVGLGIPEDLTGQRVLDIGAWDGYFSFLAEKRGASEVVAVDTTAWQKSEFGSWKNGTKKAGFEFARETLKSKVIDKEIEILDLSPENVGTFDLILCLGILYHMEDPWKVIKILSKITKKSLIIETHSDGNFLSIPAMIFYPKGFNGDSTNHWGPNVECIMAMLEIEGFKIIKVGYGNMRAVIHAEKI